MTDVVVVVLVEQGQTERRLVLDGDMKVPMEHNSLFLYPILFLLYYPLSQVKRLTFLYRKLE